MNTPKYRSCAQRGSPKERVWLVLKRRAFLLFFWVMERKRGCGNKGKQRKNVQ